MFFQQRMPSLDRVNNSQAASSMRLETRMHVILEGPRGHVVCSSICDGNRNAVSRERENELLQEIERLACI